MHMIQNGCPNILIIQNISDQLNTNTKPWFLRWKKSFWSHNMFIATVLKIKRLFVNNNNTYVTKKKLIVSLTKLLKQENIKFVKNYQKEKWY